ncbi:lipoprotein, NlpB [Halomonas korlensis]|uniref:Beta-barrel assembly machine subunit BamC n=1 Tax=Halomonas korlensis TaxID=463301 RepID=A0A1I7JHE3_9GAMM|nr:lipoprotein, NlpB [Halomonas korlensis]SFU84570.1 Beta-barrel assembly machine subunit BamC [Halomonas korlensis]
MNSALKWMPLVAVIALVTAGCAREGYYHDRNIDYAEAREGTPLTLPETRNPARYRDAMPVPEANREFHPGEEGFEAPSPQALGGGRSVEREFVERRSVGRDSWLIVAADPGTVWPQLESFANTRGLGVTSTDSASGVIETRQARLSLRQGLRAGDSEIRCDQGGTPVVECLDALEQYFSARSASASTSSLAAQRLAGEERVSLEQQGDEWVVAIPLDIDRTWAELSYQLEQEFTVEERRELLESDPQAHDFLISYMTLTERNRNPLQVVFSADVRQMSQQIRLVLESTGPEQTVLRAVNASERDFTSGDQRELLERVAGLLR